ncbi:poly-beta-1,6-N-acetyl-D-glucosamine biosynthesis protein PgaD [Cupriavidus oxalaticus]|jgi:biofilm PGA synthesis protein PgaD|uniref:Hemin storage system protein n=1 Tax=Cupriavidus oxalaticus TaxID=96344 RepID=A0A375GP40_9BURK|nr:poly-beta-1,6-N-acetyl-D-glucosamine biosynthesis protein PgaD [Cupriavidus oxalaticus]QRQ85434.1 poly-beta-1,6-N-acetyl-D-glucosamine biosynthesis protein PgaD [Cupriavidus oxalaticus]QRQ90478.1 poly-beta-1,6-N-acetyl-D-glucosamine biosynthesis protein PgaD [Cupriavidus oxalaticus]WQD84996.1 poly-beta-1,6-N-acetyl-D-glucosamine biosynthesis protein PgaD [Cupriavidus oxalaticus]SPC08341.1 Hemin storage system protein [Cupriavidus oxalaticus]SPC24233.1 Hemin storage system protein [Cupriavid
MNPDHMIIRTRRAPLRRAFDAVLTALAWTGFFYLFASGIRDILLEASAGPDVPFWSAMMPTMGTLSVYVLVGVFNGVVLLVWALYNQVRFAGMDRRKPLPPLGDDELVASFGLPGQRVRSLQQARVAVIDHDHDGGIAGVRLGEEWTVAPVRPAVAASAEACPA